MVLGLTLKSNKGYHISKCAAILEVYENIFNKSGMLVRAEKSKMASKMAAVIEIFDQNETYCY